ncbi:MAG: hypothetical protein R2729_16595 [Bryobacteraceae bacterium]
MSATVVAVIPDLFFLVKVQAAATHSGITLRTANTPAAAEAALREGASLLVIDLNCRELDPIALIRRLKQDPALKSVPVLGFVSHVQADRRREAAEAGCDRVVARSAFSDKTAELMLETTSA